MNYRQMKFDFGAVSKHERVDVMIVDSTSESVSFQSATESLDSIKSLLQGEAVQVHELPNGDRVYGLKSPQPSPGFRIAGSDVIYGTAVVLRKRHGGPMARPSCSIGQLRQMVSFHPLCEVVSIGRYA